MAQPLANTNANAERELLRAVIKRNESAKQISLLYDMSVEIDRNDKSIPVFCARRRDLDAVMADFRLWQNVILDQLVLLDRHEDYMYKDRHSKIFYDISHEYYHIKSVKIHDFDAVTSQF